MSGVEENLLPCPFCGEAAFAWEDDQHSAAWEVGYRIDDTLVCPVHPEIWAPTKAEAIAAWNRRALPVQETEGVAFSGLPSRKLETLIAQGWAISGYSLHKNGEHGFITTGGFVGWHTTAESTIQALTKRVEAMQEVFQDRVAKAHIPLFHNDPTDLAERRDRFGEEANELQQALGQTREAAHQLVDYTYDRPVGVVEKEIGAATLTLASLCVVGGWDMMTCAEADLAALQTPEKIAKVRAKRATRHGRGPLPGIDAALASEPGEGKP